MFLEISPNSQENTCVTASFIIQLQVQGSQINHNLFKNAAQARKNSYNIENQSVILKISWIMFEYDSSFYWCILKIKYRGSFCIMHSCHVSTLPLKASLKDETVIHFEGNVTGHPDSFALMVWSIFVILILLLLVTFKRVSILKHWKTLPWMV